MLVRGELLWPPLLLVGLSLLLRNRTAHPVGFAAFGVLTFYGAHALMLNGATSLLPVPMIGATTEDRILHGLAFLQVRSLAVAILATIPLLGWLYYLLKRAAP